MQLAKLVCMLQYLLQLSTNTVYLTFSALRIFARFERNLLDKYRKREMFQINVVHEKAAHIFERYEWALNFTVSRQLNNRRPPQRRL